MDQVISAVRGAQESVTIPAGSGVRGAVHGSLGRPVQPAVPARPRQPVPPAARPAGRPGVSLIPIRLEGGARSCRLCGDEASRGPGREPVDDAEHVQVLSAELLAAACAAPRRVPAAPRGTGRVVSAGACGGWRLTERGAAVIVTSFVAAVVLGLGGVVHSFLAIPDEPVEPGSVAVQVDRGR